MPEKQHALRQLAGPIGWKSEGAFGSTRISVSGGLVIKKSPINYAI